MTAERSAQARPRPLGRKSATATERVVEMESTISSSRSGSSTESPSSIRLERAAEVDCERSNLTAAAGLLADGRVTW